MNDPDKILQQRLAILCDEYLQQLGSRINSIKNIWENARYGHCNSTEIRKLHGIVHELASSGAPFGFLSISDAAHKLEQFLTSLSQINTRLSANHRRQIELLIQSLEAAAFDQEHSKHEIYNRRWEPSSLSPEIQTDTSLIFLLESNDISVKQLSTKLKQRGYKVRTFNEVHELKQALSENTVKVIITDTQISENHQEQTTHRTTRYKQGVSDPPIIFITQNNDIESRLNAIRSGSIHSFNMPLDIDRLIDKVDELTTGIPKDPYRIMIIDDDKAMADFYAHILEQEGMNVKIVNDPLKTLSEINTIRPELILLNMSMPGCSGLELTAIIRQQEDYAGISIVFLSNEAGFENQLTAINMGGDDFISLPVDPDLFIATISSRVHRARTLNTMNSNLFTAVRELENQHFAIDQHAIVSITNTNGNIIYVNEKFCDISGYEREELIGKDHNILKSDVHDADFFKFMWEIISKGEVWQGEICNRKKNGDVYWVNMTIVPFMDEQQRPYQYVAINSDITSRILAEKDLLNARDFAVKANQAKSDFLSKMSHELRTPLNAILGFSQLLERASANPTSDYQVQYTKEIKNAGNHLLNLINEVLDLSRIEANQLNVENIDIPLPSFLDECSALIMPIAIQKDITISTDYDQKEELHVNADPIRLKQIMVNLLSNAIKYNRCEGHVEINVAPGNENSIHIQVSDTGEGIQPDQIHTLFQPFSRLPQHRGEEGVGIGLALSKRLVELMGGNIGVKSTIGKGTTFWIELKKAASDTPSPETGSLSKNPEIGDVLSTPYTLLYIEDNEINFLLVKEILLKRPNINLLHATSAEDGLDMAISQTPDLILMDLQLPGMDGFDGLRELRENNLIKSIPVIAISAYADIESITRAREAGFEEYITKPIELGSFLSILDSVASRFLSQDR